MSDLKQDAKILATACLTLLASVNCPQLSQPVAALRLIGHYNTAIRHCVTADAVEQILAYAQKSDEDLQHEPEKQLKNFAKTYQAELKALQEKLSRNDSAAAKG